MIETRLKAWRLRASKASSGRTTPAIYKSFESLLVDSNLEGDVLDYGAGVGNVSRTLLAHTKRLKVTAIDLNDEGRLSLDGVNWYVGDLNEPTGFADESFDAIVNLEVIEHLENPRFQARKWARLLRRGGILIASTPNIQSLKSLVKLAVTGCHFGFAGRDYLAHITPLLRVDLKRILRESGFEKISFWYTSHGLLAFCGKITWQTISASLFKGRLFSDCVLFTAVKQS